MSYMQIHYEARKRLAKGCARCSATDRLQAALRPNVPQDRLIHDTKVGCYYSTDLDDYFTLCLPCHRRLDLVEGRPFCASGHAYTPENTSIKGDGSRRCLTCHREQEAQRREDPGVRERKQAADRAYRRAHPPTAAQKARKLELQRARRAGGRS